MKRCWGFFLSIAVMCIMFSGGKANASIKSSQQKKIINVVYDDSGSMVQDGETQYTKWCQAKYAMEVFCAMMGENDAMNIFPMSLEGTPEPTILGNNPERVASVHEMNSHYHNTPVKTVIAAANHLAQQNADTEKWLVILTDGTFSGLKSLSKTFQETLEDYAKSGIHVVYLCIGNVNNALTANESIGLYTYAAQDGSGILTEVTKIANQIFNRQVLGDAYIENKNGELTLDIDIPTNKIIIFAQGDNIKASSLMHGDQTILSTEVQNVKYSDVRPLNFPEAVLDTSMSGIIATYEAGSEPFASGSYSIEISDIRNVQIYYEPGVEIACQLMLDGIDMTNRDVLYRGIYEIALYFTDPLTGQKVESELLKGAVMNILVTGNGEEIEVNGSSNQVNLNEGELDIAVSASLPGHIELQDAYHYLIYPKPIDLNVSLKLPEVPYQVSQLGSGAEAITVTVTEAGSGNLLTEEEWNAAELTVESDSNIKWNATKEGAGISTWLIRPMYHDDPSSTSIGEIQMTVTAQYQIDTQYAVGKGSASVTVESEKARNVRLNLTMPEASIDGTYHFDAGSMAFDKESPYIMITVSEVDPVTGEAQPLTEEVWKAGTFKCRTKRSDTNATFFLVRWICGQSMDWEYELGKEVSTYKLYPKNNAIKTKILTDSLDVDISFEYISGVIRGEGQAFAQVMVKPLSIFAYIGWMIAVAVLIILTIIIIVGEIIKPRFPKEMNPTLITHPMLTAGIPDSMPRPRPCGKKIKYKYIPYRPQRRDISLNSPGYLNGISFAVEAVRGGKFKIVDIKAFRRFKETGIVFPGGIDYETAERREIIILGCSSIINVKFNTRAAEGYCELMFKRTRG